MAFDLHTIEIKSGTTMPTQSDRLVNGMLTDAVNAAGGGAGLAVVTAVVLTLPAKYNVQVTPNQDATAFVSGKTTSGFNVTITPRLATTTLGAGTFDLLITH